MGDTLKLTGLQISAIRIKMVTENSYMMTNENETQVRQLVENWAKAVRERDIEKIIAYHAAEFVMFDVPLPFKSVGLEAYRSTWDMFFKFTKPSVFDIGELTVVAGEDVAFCFATMKCADKSNSDDYIDLPFRLTIGLKKTNNQWMIVHEHHSIPAA